MLIFAQVFLKSVARAINEMRCLAEVELMNIYFLSQLREHIRGPTLSLGSMQIDDDWGEVGQTCAPSSLTLQQPPEPPPQFRLPISPRPWPSLGDQQFMSNDLSLRDDDLLHCASPFHVDMSDSAASETQPEASNEDSHEGQWLIAQSERQRKTAGASMATSENERGFANDAWQYSTAGDPMAGRKRANANFHSAPKPKSKRSKYSSSIREGRKLSNSNGRLDQLSSERKAEKEKYERYGMDYLVLPWNWKGFESKLQSICWGDREARSLSTFLRGIGDARTILALKRLLRQNRDTSRDPPVSQKADKLMQRYSRIKYHDGKISFLLLQCLADILAVFEDSEPLCRRHAGSFINTTSESHERRRSARKPGNPLKADDAEVTDAFLQAMFPHLAKGSPEWNSERGTIMKIRKEGSRLVRIKSELGNNMLWLVLVSDFEEMAKSGRQEHMYVWHDMIGTGEHADGSLASSNRRTLISRLSWSLCSPKRTFSRILQSVYQRLSKDCSPATRNL